MTMRNVAYISACEHHNIIMNENKICIYLYILEFTERLQQTQIIGMEMICCLLDLVVQLFVYCVMS